MSSARETAERIVADHMVGGKLTGAASLRDAIAAAILAEREVCAKIADEWGSDSDDGTDASAVCSAIADQIRARP